MCGLTQAVLSGRKTMTRRVENDIDFFFYLKNTEGLVLEFNQMDTFRIFSHDGFLLAEHRCRYAIGEIVAVAQRYKDAGFKDTDVVRMDEYMYETYAGQVSGWNNKMFVRADLMPHRIRIASIKIQKMQDISEEDCLKEGVMEESRMIGGVEVRKYHPSLRHVEAMKEVGWGIVHDNPKTAFSKLIDFVSGQGTWDSNPFVFVYEFELVR